MRPGARPARCGSGWRFHAGAAETRDGDYFGPSLNRVARILAIAHGGQVICSAVAAVLAGDGLPTSVELVDLGWHRLRDIDRPEQVYQVVVDDLPREFPPLRSLSTRRSNLPVQLTSFVGREKELAEVASAHRAPSARHAHRHRRDRQDPPDARGRRAPPRPPRRRRLARGTGATGRPVADPVRGRACPRCAGDPGRPGGRDGHGVPRRQGPAAPARQRGAPRRRRRDASPSGCSRTRRASAS